MTRRWLRSPSFRLGRRSANVEIEEVKQETHVTNNNSSATMASSATSESANVLPRAMKQKIFVERLRTLGSYHVEEREKSMVLLRQSYSSPALYSSPLMPTTQPSPEQHSNTSSPQRSIPRTSRDSTTTPLLRPSLELVSQVQSLYTLFTACTDGMNMDNLCAETYIDSTPPPSPPTQARAPTPVVDFHSPIPSMIDVRQNLMASSSYARESQEDTLLSHVMVLAQRDGEQDRFCTMDTVSLTSSIPTTSSMNLDWHILCKTSSFEGMLLLWNTLDCVQNRYTLDCWLCESRNFYL